MENFDLRKYLAEGRLLKEEMSLDAFLKNQLTGIEGKTEGTETVEKEEWLDMFGGTKNESGFDDIYNLIKKGKDSHSIDFGDFKANYDLKIGDDKIIIKYKTKGKLNENYDANNDLNKMDFSKLNSGQKEAFDVWIVQYAEGYFDNKAELQDMIDKFAEIENANDLEDLVHADFAGDKGERQIFIRQLERAYLDDDQPLDESSQEESIADFIINHYTNPKNGKSIIDDEIIGDFFRTHPESKEQTPEDALDNFENYLLANYDFPGSLDEKIAN